MIWWVFESTGLSLGSILSQFDPVVHQAWVDCHILHICSVFSARRHFYLVALIFSTLTRLVLMMMNQNLKVDIFLSTNGTAPPHSLFLRELSIFSVFILTRHFKSPGVTIKSWSSLAFYLILTKSCRTTFSDLGNSRLDADSGLPKLYFWRRYLSTFT